MILSSPFKNLLLGVSLLLAQQQQHGAFVEAYVETGSIVECQTKANIASSDSDSKICTGSFTKWGPSPVMPCPSDPSKEQCYNDDGWSWHYDFVGGVSAGTDLLEMTPEEKDEVFRVGSLDVFLSHDLVTCFVFASSTTSKPPYHPSGVIYQSSGTRCNSCSVCETNNGWSATFSADCTNIPQGRMIECKRPGLDFPPVDTAGNDQATPQDPVAPDSPPVSVEPTGTPTKAPSTDGPTRGIPTTSGPTQTPTELSTEMPVALNPVPPSSSPTVEDTSFMTYEEPPPTAAPTAAETWTPTTDETPVVKITLVFTFFPGAGAAATSVELDGLQTQLSKYFLARLQTFGIRDQQDFMGFWDLELAKTAYYYDATSAPDELTLEFDARITVLVRQGENEVEVAKGGADIGNSLMGDDTHFREFLVDYIRAAEPLQENIFFHTKKIFYKGISSGGRQNNIGVDSDSDSDDRGEE